MLCAASSTDPHHAGAAPDFVLTIPARAESIAVARHVLAGMADDFPVPERRLEEILLAVSEAVTNAVVHGVPDSEITLLARHEAEALYVRVTDHGKGLTVGESTHGGLGLGLGLIAQLTDELMIRAGAGSGTEIGMLFRFERALVA